MQEEIYLSRNNELYITFEYNSIKKSFLKLSIEKEGDKEKVVITPTFNRKYFTNEKIENYHMTRHDKFMHRTKYINGKPVNGPLKSYFEYNRQALDSIDSYEIIECVAVSPIVLSSELYKDYKKSKPELTLIPYENTFYVIYIFAAPKNDNKLIKDISKYGEIKYNIYRFNLFDIVIAVQSVNEINHCAVVDCLGMYIKTHANQGIGDFKPLY